MTCSDSRPIIFYIFNALNKQLIVFNKVKCLRFKI